MTCSAPVFILCSCGRVAAEGPWTFHARRLISSRIQGSHYLRRSTLRALIFLARGSALTCGYPCRRGGLMVLLFITGTGKHPAFMRLTACLG